MPDFTWLSFSGFNEGFGTWIEHKTVGNSFDRALYESIGSPGTQYITQVRLRQDGVLILDEEKVLHVL